MFYQILHLDHIQYDDQSKDAVYSSISLHRSLPLPGSTFHSVTLGSFLLYMVYFLLLHYYSYACAYQIARLCVFLTCVFDREILH